MLHSQFQEAIAFFKKPREISEFTSALKDFPWLEKTLYLEPDFLMLWRKCQNTPYDVKAAELRKIRSWIRKQCYNFLSLFSYFIIGLKFLFLEELLKSNFARMI